MATRATTSLSAGSGNDTLNGGTGNDLMAGGVGNDTYVVDSANDQVVENAAEGTDTIQSSITYSLAALPNIENLTLTGSAAINGTGNGLGNVITGNSGANILDGGVGNDTIVGAQNDTLLDGGSDNDTLSVGANFTSANNGQIVNIENVTLTTSGLTLNLANQTEGFTINGSSGADTITTGSGNDVVNTNGGADTINTGTGADVVNISAGTTATAWAVDLGSDAVTDKVVFTHASLDEDHNTVATVSNFIVANDRVAVTFNGTAIADGTFQSVTADNTNIAAGTEVVEIAINLATRVTTSLGNDGNSDDIEDIIAAAINDIPVGNYTFIVYSSTNTSTANAGIYTVNITDATNPGPVELTVEHIMTLNGVGFGQLGDANFVATVDPLILDLGAPGIDFTGLDDGVSFDINADGLPDQMAWTAGEDGILALDVDGNGTIDNGTEIFSPDFAGGEHASSLAALASLDGNGDGLIDANDAAYGSLQVWQDLDHDGVSDAGELTGLAALGITGINLGATPVDDYINGQQILSQGIFNYADGSTGSFAEVGFETELGTPQALHSEPMAGHVGDGETYHIGADDPVMTIEGFVEGDSLDLSALLDANYSEGDNVDDFVRLEQNGTDVKVQVDANGPTGGANFVDVAVLSGLGSSNADIVRVAFENQTHQLPT